MTSQENAKIVKYPLTSDDPTGGTLMVFGNPKASTLVFLHGGFPDDHHSFLPLAKFLSKEEDCLVGVACMPGYDKEDPLAECKKDGYSLEEMFAATRKAVQALIAQSEKADSVNKICYIFHDWGVIAGLGFVNRVLQEGPAISKQFIPSKIVLLDLLPPPGREDAKALLGNNPPKNSFFEIVREIAYRVVFATCFVVQRYIHSYAAVPIFLGGMAFLKLIGFSPSRQVDIKTIQERKPPLSMAQIFWKMHPRIVWMMYPYRNIFQKGGIRTLLQSYRIPATKYGIPLLYMYGADKNMMFHHPAGYKLLEEHGSKFGSEIVRVEEAGHWLFLQQTKRCHEKISNFLFGEKK